MDYIRDLKLEEASELVKKLSEEGVKLTKNEKLLLYYIGKKEEYLSIAKNRVEEYDRVLFAFKKILPKDFDKDMPLG